VGYCNHGCFVRQVGKFAKQASSAVHSPRVES
jgi:hypothetical protein